jgi:hypothetical protein
MDSRQTQRFEQTITIGGVVRTQLATKTPRFDAAGNVIGLIGISTDITERKEAERALETANEALAATVAEQTAGLTELTQHLMRVAEEEKAKLAAELHDELGSLVTAIMLDAELVLRDLPAVAPKLVERQKTIVELARRAAGLKRRIIEGLRPLLLEQFGLVPALRDYLRLWKATTGIATSEDFREDLVGLDEDAALALYRVAQESLTNIARHAGARNVTGEARPNAGERRADNRGRWNRRCPGDVAATQCPWNFRHAPADRRFRRNADDRAGREPKRDARHGAVAARPRSNRAEGPRADCGGGEPYDVSFEGTRTTQAHPGISQGRKSGLPVPTNGD